jgi:FtsP/CotA-like multicopper oxidase with cupredoxin domain
LERRDFIRMGSLALAQAGGGLYLPAQMGRGMGMNRTASPSQASPAEAGKADFTLTIAPVTLELAPDHILSTTGYNDTSPGPLLRMREGKEVSVDVINNTDVPELVHWHGMLIPPEVDGTEEEGTPPVPPHGRRRPAQGRLHGAVRVCLCRGGE